MENGNVQFVRWFCNFHRTDLVFAASFAVLFKSDVLMSISLDSEFK
jgi:hypothetical protein